MKRKTETSFLAVVGLLIAVSSGVIACSTAGGVYSTAPSPELRQVRQFEIGFTSRANELIRADNLRLAASETRIVHKKLIKGILDETLTRSTDTKDLASVSREELQLLRAAIQERVDDAHSGTDPAALNELLTARVERDFVTQRILAPRLASTVSER